MEKDSSVVRKICLNLVGTLCSVQWRPARWEKKRITKFFVVVEMGGIIANWNKNKGEFSLELCCCRFCYNQYWPREIKWRDNFVAILLARRLKKIGPYSTQVYWAHLSLITMNLKFCKSWCNLWLQWPRIKLLILFISMIIVGLSWTRNQTGSKFFTHLYGKSNFLSNDRVLLSRPAWTK